MNGTDWRTFINTSYKKNEHYGIFFELLSYETMEVSQLKRLKPKDIDVKLCALTTKMVRQGRKTKRIPAKVRIAADTMSRLQRYIKKSKLKPTDIIFDRYRSAYYDRFAALCNTLRIHSQGLGYSMRTQLQEGRASAVNEGR